MIADPLDNYVRMYRRRARLSQGEIAYLLGSRNGTIISRYELGTREPGLEEVLALAVLFDAPVRELFAGRFLSVRRKVRTRIGKLIRKLRRRAVNPRDRAKIEYLSRLIKNS